MKRLKRSLAIGVAAIFANISTAQAADVNVSFTNNAPGGGTYQTPAWVGFHDGTFDVFDAGAAASGALEMIAEDGDTSGLFAAFAGSGVDAMVGGGPIGPGGSADVTVSVAEDGSNNYFSFASMVLPSSDYFIGNDNPLLVSIAGLLDGTFNKISFDVIRVYDAGTEVNDFATSAGNPLFGLPGGQLGVPNTGATEGGVVTIVSSTDPFGAFPGAGGTDISGLNFSDYDSIATFTLTTPVPVPAALPLLLSALGGLGFAVRRKA